MDSLLTLSTGQFLSVETTLRGAFALVAMGSLLLLLACACVPSLLRLPLIIGGVALAGSAWLESLVLASWQGAFEPAGTSYCVTGLAIDDPARVLAWAIGVPGLLIALGMARIPWGKRGGYLLEQNTAVLCLMGLLSLFTTAGGFFLMLWSGYLSCIRMIPHALPSTRSQGYIAFGAVTLGMALKSMGSMHMLPLGTDPALLLVRGEVVRTVADLLCLLVPALILAVRVVSRNHSEEKENAAS
jgi:hypothetical protein